MNIQCCCMIFSLFILRAPSRHSQSGNAPSNHRILIFFSSPSSSSSLHPPLFLSSYISLSSHSQLPSRSLPSFTNPALSFKQSRFLASGSVRILPDPLDFAHSVKLTFPTSSHNTSHIHHNACHSRPAQCCPHSLDPLRRQTFRPS